MTAALILCSDGLFLVVLFGGDDETGIGLGGDIAGAGEGDLGQHRANQLIDEHGEEDNIAHKGTLRAHGLGGGQGEYAGAQSDRLPHCLVLEVHGLQGFSGSTPLYDTLMPLHKQLLKYRKASVENEVRSTYSSQEHRAIYEAIASHNAPLAEERMRAHIANAKDFIQKKGEK